MVRLALWKSQNMLTGVLNSTINELDKKKETIDQLQ